VENLAVTKEPRPISDIVQDFDASTAAAKAYALVEALYPICRSITGDGIRRSLHMLSDVVPLKVHEVPTGTPVFDWIVPKEWNIQDAYIKNSTGERVVDFRRNSLHVLNYSVPVRRTLSLAELRQYLFSAPETPDWIPYRTSYYLEAWGFCLSHRQLETLEDGDYEVCIDSTLEPGHLSYGEFRIQGATDAEVLISCHSCHPALCNDNLAAMTVAAQLARALSEAALRYSYRFIWIPGTIGAITWLAQNEGVLRSIKHGLVLSCLGDAGAFTYKRSRHASADIDRAVEMVLRQSGHPFTIRDFVPYGYDERQYCSPGINLPVGCFMRTPNGEYPQYHTSADDLTLVTPRAMEESMRQLLTIVDTLERNLSYVNLQPKCEPQLGRRGLYRQMGGMRAARNSQMAMLWVLNYSDGSHDLIDIATRSGLSFRDVASAARTLQASGLLDPSEQ
jgi:aminopeptidase-like protein